MREKSSNYSSIKESYCIAINFKAFLSSRLPDSGCRNSSHVAAGRVGAMRVRLHQTSLTHNLWKLWRRSVCLLEQCLLSASMAHGGFYFTLETERDRLWQPRSDHVAPARRADVLQRSPMVAFMDLLLVWRLEVWTTHRAYPVETDGCKWAFGNSLDGWEVFLEVRRHRVRPPPAPHTTENEEEEVSSGNEGLRTCFKKFHMTDNGACNWCYNELFSVWQHHQALTLQHVCLKLQVGLLEHQQNVSKYLI